jgi:NAD(P)-dependent dehydrogenase (short-subunit alcohol dehydrogenase family)
MTAEKKKRKRVALVTGANRGLGFETCLQLAQLGLTVILSARDFTKGEAAAKQLLERGLDVIFYELDVSGLQRCQTMVQAEAFSLIANLLHGR